MRANLITPFNGLILGLAIAVALVDQSLVNALFFVVVFINSGIGIFQELKAKRTLDKLAILNAPLARVVRDGKEQEIAVDEVVLDDVLHLKLGDQVVADGEFIETSEIEIDESLLTGESDPIYKKVGDTALSGSIVVAGEGYIRVTAVGADSYSAKITLHAKRFQRARSELVHSTNLLLKWISWMLVIVVPLLVLGQLRIDADDWRGAIVHTSAAIVGMIPEGLVLLTSAAFMLAAMTLARRKVLVQQMPAVECLARVDTLLLDKTGTLTEGNIKFEAIVEVEKTDQALVKSVLKTMSLRATSPTNDAIREALEESKKLKFSSEVPFSSARKWSALTIDRKNWILGAPEVLFANRNDKVFKRAKELAADGKRVLVLMSARQKPHIDKLPEGCKPEALVILSERIRSDAQETLRYFADQGVDIKVISGDSPLTVAAVARRVGLKIDQPYDARELPRSDKKCLKIIQAYSAFGRVQPEQKRRIAKLLQSIGRTVAMTGDGVNDALALKDADIGIAMNSGAPATKAVAELVLMDGKFAHLPNVLLEGRRVIANIERVANLFIIKNVYSLVFSLAVTAVGLRYPFLPIQMSVISALTIGVPAFFLALAPNKKIYKPGFLGRVLKFAVPVGVISAVAMLVGYALADKLGVLSPAAAGTTVSIIAMTIGTWVLVCLAKPLNAWKLALIGMMDVIFVSQLTIPVSAEFFRYHLALVNWPITITVSLVAILLVGFVYRKVSNSHERHGRIGI
jgi:cation-transporting ATPase E